LKELSRYGKLYYEAIDVIRSEDVYGFADYVHEKSLTYDRPEAEKSRNDEHSPINIKI